MAVKPAQGSENPGANDASPPAAATGSGTSRRSLLTLTGAAALTATAVAASAPAASAAASTGGAADPLGRRPSSFVTVRHGRFELDGAAWRFGGTNCYYLQHLHQRNLGQCSDWSWS